MNNDKLAFTLEQLIFISVNIHSWEKTPLEIVRRAVDLYHHCENMYGAKESVKEMGNSGMSALEIMKEVGFTDVGGVIEHMKSLGLPVTPEIEAEIRKDFLANE